MRPGGIWLERAKASAALYRQYTTIFEELSKIHADRNAGTRVKALLRLVRGGAYGSNNTWDFSYGSLLKDSAMAMSYDALAGLSI